jgi:hypothetical protein
VGHPKRAAIRAVRVDRYDRVQRSAELAIGDVHAM